MNLLIASGMDRIFNSRGETCKPICMHARHRFDQGCNLQLGDLDGVGYSISVSYKSYLVWQHINNLHPQTNPTNSITYQLIQGGCQTRVAVKRETRLLRLSL